jgi:RNA polymerase sigma factor (sigma-70 family)
MNTSVKNFDNIYRKNYKRILKYVNFKLHNESSAEELTDDIFLKFDNHFEKFLESGLDEKTYLFNITNTKIIDWSRNKEYTRRKAYVSIQSRFNSNEDSQSIEDTLEDVSKTPDELLEDADNLKFIKVFLDKIKNEKVRLCIELRYFDGMKYGEISEETGYSLECVKTNIHRGLHELKDAIAKKIK